LRAVLRIFGQDHTRCKNRYGTICATESHFCKKKVVWAQPCGEGRKLHGMGVVDWIGLDSEQDWTNRPISTFGEAEEGWGLYDERVLA